MDSNSPIPQIPAELKDVLEELRGLEPIFHRASFGANTEDFDRRMGPDFWEVGASGRIYTRAFILDTFQKSFPTITPQTEQWKTSEFGLRQLGPDTFLLTYTLDQCGRMSRRVTLWQRAPQGWQILYHQGTLVEASTPQA
jgi:hypothetical protein